MGIEHFTDDPSVPAVSSSVRAKLRTIDKESDSAVRFSCCIATALIPASTLPSACRVERVQFKAFCQVSNMATNLSRHLFVTAEETSPAFAVEYAKDSRVLR